MNWTEIAELHNDQSGFIRIEQIYIKVSSSKGKSMLLVHQPLQQNGAHKPHLLCMEMLIKYFYFLSAECHSSMIE